MKFLLSFLCFEIHTAKKDVFMKIVSWNCNGAFRKKFLDISEYDADIYVIQECENPETVTGENYERFACNYIWKGDMPYKGLGVFAKQNILLEPKAWNNHLLRHFFPVGVNGSFTLLAVWACRPYIEEYAVYQDIHYAKYDANMIIIGDFNSNKIWDCKRTEQRSHSAVLEKLNRKGLSSAYHSVHNEEQGHETIGTFFLYKNSAKQYHIDYCFLNTAKLKDFFIAEKDLWLRLSDHIPLVLSV
jgi:exonuclease III